MKLKFNMTRFDLLNDGKISKDDVYVVVGFR